MSRPVVLSPPQPGWAQLFEREAAMIRAIGGDEILAVHHVGSTAVLGVFAKPIVDIMPVVTSLSRVDELRGAFEAHAYIWKGEHGIERRRYVVREREDENEDLTHIHIFEESHVEVTRHLAFRDFLRAEPKVATEYDELKRALAERFANERQRYQEEKGPFIEDVLRRAMGNRYVGPSNSNSNNQRRR
jgi:GrpB-like predicted nucleotidyltransferase (UPF0157 family)